MIYGSGHETAAARLPPVFAINRQQNQVTRYATVIKKRRPVLLTLGEVAAGFPSQRVVIRSFGVSVVISLNCSN